MEIVTQRDGETRHGPRDWFTGVVWIHQASGEGGGLFRVLFEPGARTHWHTHPEGQYLHIIAGRGRVGTEDGTVREVTTGDLVYFAPGERHWHGAAPDAFMVHVAITPAIKTEGGTEWLAPVTEEEYGEDG
ncbi:MAG: cupin domain-containing protein [Actinomycetota bacterium]